MNDEKKVYEVDVEFTVTKRETYEVTAENPDDAAEFAYELIDDDFIEADVVSVREME